MFDNRLKYVSLSRATDIKHINIAMIDIEVGSENGFPDPYKATEPITAIAWKTLNGGIRVYGCDDYKRNGDEDYIKCDSEYDLCKRFLQDWQNDCPDVVTGWNTNFFDIPYLVNRFRNILGEDEAKKLSPWNLISEREAYVMNRKMTVYDLVGIGDFDLRLDAAKVGIAANDPGDDCTVVVMCCRGPCISPGHIPRLATHPGRDQHEFQIDKN